METPPGKRRARRLWCLPPAMLRDPAESFEGERILGESSGDLGLLLWRTVRDVTLWATTPAGARGGLFAEGSADLRIARLASTDVPPEITPSVDSIHSMLTMASRADAETLSICCLEVAAWARRAGLVHTAIAFAQAGALASPDFAEAALHTGIYAAAVGQDARAETWLRRAIGLGRREKNRTAYAAALVGLGVFSERRGDRERAERLFRYAYERAGRRYSVRNARMGAAHGLFRLARARGDELAAAQFALMAQRAYEPGARGGPELLLDLGQFWTDLGERDRAHAVLWRLAPFRSSLPPADQLGAAALSARAGVDLPDDARGRGNATAVAWDLMGDEAIPVNGRFAAALHLAHAARSAGDLVAFTRAKRAVMTLAPPDAFPSVAREITELWPDGEAPESRVERAS